MDPKGAKGKTKYNRKTLEEFLKELIKYFDKKGVLISFFV